MAFSHPPLLHQYQLSHPIHPCYTSITSHTYPCYAIFTFHSHPCYIIISSHIHSSFSYFQFSGADCPTTQVLYSTLSSINCQPVVFTQLTGIVNPLVAAWLISPDLTDILVTSSEDDAVSKKRTVTGVRDLTIESC